MTAVRLDPAAAARLAARIVARDEAGLRELHRLYARGVYAFAWQRLRDDAQAEEAVADTFFEVWRHAERFRGESQLSTWIFGIARNVVANMLRARKPAADELDENLPAADLGTFEQVAEAELREGMRRCLAGLSDVHRECLVLVFYEGLSLAEVAAVQGCPENTVKTRLFHARKNIKDCVSRFHEQ